MALKITRLYFSGLYNLNITFTLLIMTTKDDNTSVSSLLQNKLGSTTQLWSFGSTVVSQYTFEKLLLIKECFPSLDSLVKFKFFLTLFHIPKRNLDEVKYTNIDILIS